MQPALVRNSPTHVNRKLEGRVLEGVGCAVSRKEESRACGLLQQACGSRVAGKGRVTACPALGCQVRPQALTPALSDEVRRCC